MFSYLLLVRQCSKYFTCHLMLYQISGYALLKHHGFLKNSFCIKIRHFSQTEIIFPGHYFLFSYLVKVLWKLIFDLHQLF